MTAWTQSRPTFVRELMTTDPVCVYADESVHTLARVLDDNGVSGVPVLDRMERVVGVVSRPDVLHRCVEGAFSGRGRSLLSALAEGIRGSIDTDELGQVDDIMTDDPFCVSPDEPVGAVAEVLVRQRLHRAVVVDEASRVVGIVTCLDLLKAVPSG